MRTLRRYVRYLRLIFSIALTALRQPTRTVSRIAQVLNTVVWRYPELIGGSNFTQSISGHLPNVVPLDLDVRPELSRCRHLNVLVPGMACQAMSGGPNTAVNLAYRLARTGQPVRFLSTDIPKEKDERRLWDHIHQLTGVAERLPHVSIHDAHPGSPAVAVGENDVFLATAWWTAQRVKLAVTLTPEIRTKRFLYLIQEIEPELYPWSTSFALAAETYELDFHAIVNERLVLDHLCESAIGRFSDVRFAGRCAVFEPAIDRHKFFPEKKPATARRRLVFYARPNAPRNLFELGIAALKRAVDQGAFAAADWELLFIGEQLPNGDLGRGQVIRSSPWLSFDDYAALLRSSDIGLSLMLSPHTSYPPLEMAACGVQVVTNVFSTKSADRLRDLSECIVPVSPTVEGITEGLLTAARRCQADQPPATSGIRLPKTWDDVFDGLLPRVQQMIEDCSPTYETRDLSAA